ncbi:hypothetical protein [Streptomyces sp. NPDC048845]|uniref:hypothetical protein n=1 Tax=Streptomyces sp. NPDC048845 TaxID=3155390 RepID=UPI0034271D88
MRAQDFLLLSTSTSPFLSLTDSAGLLHREPAAAENLLESLVDAGLLTPTGLAHYQVPVLAQLYATTLQTP